MTPHTLIITASGITYVGDLPALERALGGTVTRQRVSHIWPSHWLLRALFRVLRSTFGDTGRIADWTRRWPCQCQVRWVSNMKHVVFIGSRKDCEQWEKPRAILHCFKPRH